MALGNDAINKVSAKVEDMRSQFVALKDQANTFDYVTRNLSEWASETDVGSELRAGLQSAVKSFKQMISNSETLAQNIDSFLEIQKKINEKTGR